jgi:regulatory protein
MESASPQKKSPKKRSEPKPPKKISDRYLYNAGLYYLKRYTASTSHFRNVMMRKIRKSCKFHTDQDIEKCKELLEKTMETLCEQGYLNDKQYTHGMVSSYRKRGVSKKYIQARLAQKGLPADLIIDTITTIDSQSFTIHENPEIAAAITHARKKRLGAYKTTPASEKDLQRALGSFARAGFSYDIAKYVLEMSSDKKQDGY